jgi:hypothetical protein
MEIRKNLIIPFNLIFHISLGIFMDLLKKLFFHVSELPRQKGIMSWIVPYEKSINQN